VAVRPIHHGRDGESMPLVLLHVPEFQRA